MDERFVRSEPLFSADGLKKLNGAHVIVFGLGGVGGAAAEALVRGGIGSVTLVDCDSFTLSNLNRQILATEKTLGKSKASVAAERARDINSTVNVVAVEKRFVPGDSEWFVPQKYDYIADCIDDVKAKVALIESATKNNVPIISCMGTGNKLDPTRFRVADIYSTDVCPLCRVMRKKLRDAGITKLDVVFSDEKPLVSPVTPSSTSFCPPVAGYILAAHIIKKLAL